MILKQPKHYENAIRYACTLHAIPVRIYTNEKNSDLITIDIDITPEEAWLLSAEIQLKIREEEIKDFETKIQSAGFLDFFKIDNGKE